MSPGEAVRFADYIKSLPDFDFIDDGPYDHIGATIADAVLQPQRDYDDFVTPKTDRILRLWRDVKTLSQLVELLKSVPASEFLDWNDNKDSRSWLGHRVERFRTIVSLFKSEGSIEAEDDLRPWLLDDCNPPKLYAIWGVGQKTVNYLGSLVGLPWVAIDSRLSWFIGASGLLIKPNDLTAQREVVCLAADILGVDRRVLDHSIWVYAGNKKPAENANKAASNRQCCPSFPKNQKDASLSA
jgi:hypothetical protein